MTSVGEGFEGADHRLDFCPLDLQLVDMAERQRLDVDARARTVSPERQELANLLDGETEIARAADEAQAMDVPADHSRGSPIRRVRPSE